MENLFSECILWKDEIVLKCLSVAEEHSTPTDENLKCCLMLNIAHVSWYTRSVKVSYKSSCSLD